MADAAPGGLILSGLGGAAGVAAFAPGESFRAHHHRRVTETFVCTSGVITVAIGDEVHELHPGDAAVAPPGVVHQTSNRSDRPAEVIYVKVPGDMDDFVWADEQSDEETR